jgi:hypothetical protein
MTSGWLSRDSSAEGLAGLSPWAPGPKAVMTVLAQGLLPFDLVIVRAAASDVKWLATAAAARRRALSARRPDGAGR